MEVSHLVETFNPMEELIHQNQCCLEGELVFTVSEEILEIGSQKFKHQRLEVTVIAKPEY